MTPKRVIIDTDPGIDDALALILAFASPELSVEAITTVAGNVEVELAARNACAQRSQPGPSDQYLPLTLFD